MGRVEGKVVFVTGGGTGIGRAASRRFAAEGARVVVAELNPASGEETERLIRAEGGEATFVRTDITVAEQVESAVGAAVDRYGRLDVIYNCAGGSIPEDGPITEVDWMVYDHTISLDLEGTMLCCRYGIPRLVEAGGGSVVNMSSTAALQGVRMHVYSAAKGAIISLTRSLASRYARDGVRANAICPGFVLTERVRGRFGTADGERPAQTERVAKQYPFGVGEPEDIANIAVFLASDESRMINGAIIAADGGMSAY
jgi:NAD(P)-dependent dehydrogenase (short-subunit alcohol dehydrogenase family)